MSSKRNINNIRKNYSLGIIGGGQLALMLTEAAKNRNLDVCVQTKSPFDPAALKADYVIEADPLKIKGNKYLLNICEKIIFENEWIKIEKLKSFESDNVFIPSLKAIQPLVDRISQKKLIDSLNIPCPKWTTLKNFKKLTEEEIKKWNFPLMAKSNKGGYDGKGNKKIHNLDELDSFLVQNDYDEWLIEEWINYDSELALVGSRDQNGKIRVFPIVQTFQANKVCDWVLAPAAKNYDLNSFALNIFSSIVNELNYVGVLGIEFFFGINGLLVNEIAPRTHNSAHFSIEACTSSQFDQYICISSGITPPEIKMISEGAVMINLLGLKKNFPISIDSRLKLLSQVKGANLHWYGKSKEILGRKMAHITFLLKGQTHLERLQEAEEILVKVRNIWPSPNAPKNKLK